MHCPEYVWEMKDLTVNSKIDIFQEKYTDSQNAQNKSVTIAKTCAIMYNVPNGCKAGSTALQILMRRQYGSERGKSL